MTADPDARLRADARRNRDQIVAAAKTWFATHGPEAPMEEIARTAGVGVGTLYRRFPDREALIRAVGRDNLTKALTEAHAAVAEELTAWGALVRFLGQLRELRLSVQLAMASPLAREVLADDPKAGEVRRALLLLLDKVVHAAQAEGTLRTDVDTGDVAMLFVLLAKPVMLPKEETARLAAERSVALMLDGLRAQPGSALPGVALTSADIGL
jgi:AcrR family transcriptional regulator